ncbi:MAG: hypothetical protein U1E83_10555 [Methylotetracoccus sp.]
MTSLHFDARNDASDEVSIGRWRKSLMSCATALLASLIALPIEGAADSAYEHPYRQLAKGPGPIPLFERRDDPDGHRYVIGEGGSMAGETGVLTREPVVTTMLAVAPRDRVEEPRPVRVARARPSPKITPDLAARLSAATSSQAVPVEISLRRREPGIQAMIDRMLARGEIRTRADLQAARARLIGQRQIRIAERLRPFVAAIASAGGRVSYVCRNSECLFAELPRPVVQRLAADPEVIGLDAQRPMLAAGISGATVRTGAQIGQFFASGNPGSSSSYDGDGLDEVSGTDDVVFAVVEPGAGYAPHVGFGEDADPLDSRIVGRWECDDDCQSVIAFGGASGHSTAVAGILFGDLTDGQGNFAAADRIAGSGYAPEARGHLYTGGKVALDHIAGLFLWRPDLVSNSWGYIESPECSGASTTSRSANALFLDGIAVFSAAHNRGGSANQCRVTAPGSAIGNFTVGAHIDPDSEDPTTYDGLDDVRFGPLRVTSSPSSWGGNATQGQNRSIISLTGPSTRTHKFGTAGGLIESGGVCCTSLATPTVASAAMSYIDFYRHRWSNFIDNPGVLYANMLLMGDRQGQAGKIDGPATAPDHRWGMGRLRMRMTGNGKLDVPWAFRSAETCIGHGETWDLPVNGGKALPADADVLKFAAYWYDHRHDGSAGDAGSVANVNVYLTGVSGGRSLAYDNDAFDNKARLYYHDIGGKAVKIRFYGTDIAGHDDSVCGADSVHVWFALFWEDSDRESPTYDPVTLDGIMPENL